MVRPWVIWLNDPYRPVKQAIIASYQSLTHFLETVAELRLPIRTNSGMLQHPKRNIKLEQLSPKLVASGHEVYSSQPGTHIEGSA
jgi:hypothetical protein